MWYRDGCDCHSDVMCRDTISHSDEPLYDTDGRHFGGHCVSSQNAGASIPSFQTEMNAHRCHFCRQSVGSDCSKDGRGYLVCPRCSEFFRLRDESSDGSSSFPLAGLALAWWNELRTCSVIGEQLLDYFTSSSLSRIVCQ